MAPSRGKVAERRIRARVVTVSDGCFAGTREDVSGPAVAGLLSENGIEIAGTEVVPDERDRIIEAIQAGVADGDDLVVTTGGTGIAARDVTPQATRDMLDYEIPGIGEEMRRAGMQSTPMAMISRGLAGVSGQTLVLNLPGSMRGAVESLAAVLPAIGHAVDLLHGHTAHAPDTASSAGAGEGSQ